MTRARYIVRPGGPRVASEVSLAATALTPQARTAQVEAANALRNDAPAARELERWLQDSARTTVRRLSTPLSIVGTVVLEMEDEDLEELSTITDVRVVKDQALNLIRPAPAALTAGSGPDERWHLDAIGLSRARAAGTAGDGADVAVAVVDTGVDASHPEFAGKAIEMVAFDVDRWQITSTQQSVDTDGHGTHVAGLVAGRRVGVAPATTIINARMMPDGTSSSAGMVLALEWAASRADVAIMNMSAGIPGYFPGMEEMVEDLLAVGVLPVVAVGNEGRSRTSSPGNYNSVLSVGACNVHGAVSSFSGSGTYTVEHQTHHVPDLVAPGEAVTSSFLGGGYDAWNGTSMAAPIVSGIAALILQKHPTISVLDLSDALLDTCHDLGVATERQGAGLIQVAPATVDDWHSLSGTSSARSRPTRDSNAKEAEHRPFDTAQGL